MSGVYKSVVRDLLQVIVDCDATTSASVLGALATTYGLVGTFSEPAHGLKCEDLRGLVSNACRVVDVWMATSTEAIDSSHVARLLNVVATLSGVTGSAQEIATVPSSRPGVEPAGVEPEPAVMAESDGAPNDVSETGAETSEASAAPFPPSVLSAPLLAYCALAQYDRPLGHADVSSVTGLSDGDAKAALHWLLSTGIVDPVGNTRGRRYVLKTGAKRDRSMHAVVWKRLRQEWRGRPGIVPQGSKTYSIQLDGAEQATLERVKLKAGLSSVNETVYKAVMIGLDAMDSTAEYPQQRYEDPPEDLVRIVPQSEREAFIRRWRGI